MAKASVELIAVLRRTANKLQKSKEYQWGHMGSCNCGFLAQEITDLTKKQIHERAMNRHGDWNEQLNEYCPTSGLLMDDLIDEMLAIGFNATDLKQLERLSSPKVIEALPESKKHLKYNYRDDVVLYLNTWAELLEKELIQGVQLPMMEHLSVEA